jgi:NAD(P)-dependent dehydrogenase (short-subunit alcohol dehydrogenase family)
MQEAEVVALPRIIVKRWPEAGVDVLVNNAGLSRNNSALLDGSTASWVEMISTNVLGLCMCSREAVQVAVSPPPFFLC